jgi:hypothetical protein
MAYGAENYRGPTYTGEFDLIEESEMALKLWDGTGSPQSHAKWVPKSQIKWCEKIPGREKGVEVEMKEWIAKENEFI